MTSVNMLGKLSIATAGAAIIALGVAGNAQAATITLLQDNFNNENGGNEALNYNGFTNWNVTGGTVDLIGNGGVFDFLPGNGLYVDTDGSTRNAGILSSKNTFAFGAGDVVNLSFELAGNQRTNVSDKVIVSLGSLYNETFTLPFKQGFTTFTRSFVVGSATSAKLAFEGVGGDNIGLLLDDVKLTKTVPEPASIIGVLGLGAFSVTSLCKRKQQPSAKA